MSKKLVFLVILGTVFVLGMISLIVINYSLEESGNNIIEVEEAPSISGQPIIGNKDSLISIVEFGDFKCPGCKSWHDIIFEKINDEYIETGKVKFSFISVLFHGNESIIASLAAKHIHEHHPEKYWEFHKTIFNNQEKEFTIEEVLNMAGKLEEVDKEALKETLIDQKMEMQLQKDIELVNKFEIKQTPTIFINNKKVADPFDYKSISKIIDEELDKKYE